MQHFLNYKHFILIRRFIIKTKLLPYQFYKNFFIFENKYI